MAGYGRGTRRAAVRIYHFPPLGSPRNTRNSSPQPSAVSVIARTGAIRYARRYVGSCIEPSAKSSLCFGVNHARSNLGAWERSLHSSWCISPEAVAFCPTMYARSACAICPDVFIPVKSTLRSRTRSQSKRNIAEMGEQRILLHGRY